MNYPKLGEDFEDLCNFAHQSSKDSRVSCQGAIEVLMGHIINSFTFIEFAFYLGKLSSKAFRTDFVDQPEVVFVLHLVYQTGNRAYAWVLFGIDGVPSFEVIVFDAFAAVFYLKREESAERFDLNFG